MTPYEVYFYSSGAVEERLAAEGLGLNRVNAMIGYALGGLLSFALMIVAAALFLPRGIEPQFLGTRRARRAGAARPDRAAARAGRHPVRGRRRGDRDVLLRRLQPRAVLRLGVGQAPPAAAARRGSRSTWLVLLVLALADRRDGRRPGDGDRVLGDLLRRRAAAHLPADPAGRERPRLHGQHRNGRLANVLGVIYLVIILVVAVAAIPLMLITNRDRDERRGSSTSASASSTTSSSTPRGGAAATSTTSSSRASRQGAPRVTRSSSGRRVWRGRGRLGRLAALARGGRPCACPWEEVEKIDSAVHLRKTARELGSAAATTVPALGRDGSRGPDAALRSPRRSGPPSRASASAASTTCGPS